jgi:predicted CopG family antitoxin
MVSQQPAESPSMGKCLSQVHDCKTDTHGTLLRMGTHTYSMSKNIAISDDVYRELKREKGERSFSDVIRDNLEEHRRLADVTGTGVLDPDTQAAVKDDVERLSQGTLSRLDDETL